MTLQERITTFLADPTQEEWDRLCALALPTHARNAYMHDDALAATRLHMLAALLDGGAIHHGSPFFQTLEWIARGHGAIEVGPWVQAKPRPGAPWGW